MLTPNKKPYTVGLNFLTLKEQEFAFEIYRKPYRHSEKPHFREECRVLSLPIDPEGDTDADENRASYLVALTPLADFESYVAHCDDNRYVTEWFLYELLRTKSAQQLLSHQFHAQDKFRKKISFTIQDHPGIGQESVWLEPYYLSDERCFGYLIEFNFKKLHTVSFGRKIQQLSLSLDSLGRRNRNFNIDKNAKIQAFIKQILPKLFPLVSGDLTIDINTNFFSLTAKSLNVKKYLFGNEKPDISQFRGIRDYGPYKMPSVSKVNYLFVFLEKHRGYARDLLLALRGKEFSGLFPGFEQMFKLKFDNDNVVGFPINEYSEDNFKAVQRKAVSVNGEITLPVFIIPSKLDPTNEKIYYTIKHVFVDKFIPVQVVTLDVLQNKETLKWSVANIALQMFGKVGGFPWKVEPNNTKCLIIGIGTRHDVRKEGGQVTVDKYFAYSVLTDSSGLYLDLEVLSESTQKNSYLADLKASIGGLVEKYQNEYNKIVIHTPFKIDRDEMEAIQKILDDYHSDDHEFVVLKINIENKFFGYNEGVSSLVPYESSYVRLAWKEYLVWFEGLQYHNPNALSLYSGPSHIEFHYESRELTDNDRLGYLQDALNLSGANWRGFNAKSLPVSIFYCRLVADFVMHFKKLGYRDFNIKNFTPWFL